MKPPKSWRLTITRNVTCPQWPGLPVVVAAGTYTLVELSDISYAIRDDGSRIATLLVSDVAVGLAGGAFILDRPWP